MLGLDNALYQLPPVVEEFNMFDVTDPGLLDTTVGQAVSPSPSTLYSPTSTSVDIGETPMVLTPPPDLTSDMDTTQVPPTSGRTKPDGTLINKGKNVLTNIYDKVTSAVTTAEQNRQSKPKVIVAITPNNQVNMTQFVVWILIILLVVIIVVALVVGGKRLHERIKASSSY